YILVNTSTANRFHHKGSSIMASALTGPIAAFNESLTSIFFQFIEESVWNVGSWSGPLIDGFVAPKITP
ncbi:hypothetical protein, partial [Pseudoglutamicibacter cumminsii]|uniref:hypothetical protein n=1 Tax=Pseudoglutamicibacter cumminsii TaxID=156979 RepID=UPI0026E986AA